jgi:hypothetical protein
MRALTTTWRRATSAGVATWAALALASPASAQVLDDVEVRTHEGVAEIRLLFSVPVRYIKHFPPEQGALIKLYLQVATLDGLTEMPPEEYKRTPTIPLVPRFTVMYSTVRSCFAVRDPLCLDIQFNRPVRYRVAPGQDGRSILLTVLPENDPQQYPPAQNRSP